MNDNTRLRGAVAALVVGLTLASAPARATTIFSDGMVNAVDGVIDDIEIRNSEANAPTFVISETAQVGFVDDGMGGLVSSNEDQSVAVFGSSRLNMLGGETADSIVANENATVIILGGAIGDDVVANENSVVIYENAAADDLTLSGAALVTMASGEFDTVELTGSTVYRFIGGLVDDIDNAGDDSSVFIGPGARVDDDSFFTGNATVEVTGGQFDDEFQLLGNNVGTFTGGAIGDDLVIEGTSRATIENLTVGDSIETGGDSHTTILSGTFGEIAGSGDVEFLGGVVESGIIQNLGGKATIDGGQILPGDGEEVSAALGGVVEVVSLTLEDAFDASANAGGELGIGNVTATDINVNAIASEVEITGPDTGVLSVTADLGSSVEILGGEADELNVLAQLDSEVAIRGGSFAFGDITAAPGSTITIFGPSFEIFGLVVGDDIPFGPIPFAAGDLTGILRDGSPIDFDFQRNPDANIGQIILVQVPEPATLGLAGCLVAASLVASRRRV